MLLHIKVPTKATKIVHEKYHVTIIYHHNFVYYYIPFISHSPICVKLNFGIIDRYSINSDIIHNFSSYQEYILFPLSPQLIFKCVYCIENL